MRLIHQDSFLTRVSSLSPHALSPEAWGTLAKLMDGAIDTCVCDLGLWILGRVVVVVVCGGGSQVCAYGH